MHQGCDPRDLGQDVGDTGDFSTGHRTGGGGEDLRDAVINYAIEILGIPVAQELESTPESMTSGVNR